MTVGLLEAALFAGCGQATAPETAAPAESGASQESGEAGESGESAEGAEQKGEAADGIMEEIWDANTPEALLKNHESVTVTTVRESGGTTVSFQNKEMHAEETTGSEDPAKNTSYISDGEYEGCIYADGEGNERFARILYAMEDAEVQPLEDFQLVVREEDCLDRTASESKEEGGVLTVKAALDEEATRDELGLFYGLIIPEEYRDATCAFIYQMDPATKELQTFSKVLTLADGSEKEIEKTEVVFDGKVPDGIQRIADLLDDSMNAEDDRDITVFVEPGTENEEKYSFNIGRGISANIICDDGYALFTDNIGKDLFTEDNPEKDLELYSLPVEEYHPVSSYSEAGEPLEDGVYSGSIDPASLKKDGDTWKLSVEMFGYEQFSVTELAELAPGDVLYILEKPVTVKKTAAVKGPSGKADGLNITDRNGVEYKFIKDDKIYYVKGEETSHQLFSLGTAEYELASDMNIVDTTKETPASDAEVTGIGDLPGSVEKSSNKDWSAAANDVILQGGKIARIIRKEAE